MAWRSRPSRTGGSRRGLARHMALVAAIEDEFGVELDSDQVLDMASFSIALKMLGDLGVDG